MSSRPCIQFRVPAEVKALLRALAAREGTSESALMKRMLVPLLRAADLGSLQGIKGRPSEDGLGGHKRGRPMRLYVRLDPNDLVLLEERAAARGVAAATYVAALTRAHLRVITPLMREERAALDRVVSELTAVGRNLNQIARALNQGQNARAGRDELQAMLKVCNGLRDHVKALLSANEKSWSDGYGGTKQ